MKTILPWQKAEWSYLASRRAQGKLSHALLLTGLEGLGQSDFAHAFAASLLCQNPNDIACGSCSSCQLLAAGNHPDLLVVNPEAKDKLIKVDQIREVISELGKTSQQGGYQVVIIEPADAMNIAAANALLKTLEEPAQKVQIILISSKAAFLSATIRSRCQQLVFKSPTNMLAKEWLSSKLALHNEQADPDLLLSLAGGAPLKALQFATADASSERSAFANAFFAFANGKLSAINFAEECQNYPLSFVLGILLSFIADMLKLQVSLASPIVNIDLRDNLQHLAAKLPLANILEFSDKVVQLVAINSKKININKQTALEALWIELGRVQKSN
ncbi:MAG: DNA polymerase III subunit delta' [Gammaproteobacteria bacterium]|nr:DNA polymerase III subunit delta' [Gammaproteobacteria bacterium]